MIDASLSECETLKMTKEQTAISDVTMATTSGKKCHGMFCRYTTKRRELNTKVLFMIPAPRREERATVTPLAVLLFE